MRILLSTIGTRGDVQPLLALGLHLKALQHEVRFCVPPDFKDSITSLGMHVTAIGPELRSMGMAGAGAAPPTPEQIKLMVEGTVRAQFKMISEAAKGCDMIVGATALQIAAPSVAEKLGIPYIFVAYCPAVLPSPDHAPPVLSLHGHSPEAHPSEFKTLWDRDADIFNSTFGAALNAERSALGLTPVHDVRAHVLTGRPWLAADRTLGPWPDASRDEVFQTGAWMVPDERPLADEIEAFLEVGEAPIYFGFGSMRAASDLSLVMIQSARALGRRVILSSGWAEFSSIDSEPDCLVIDEVNQQALFPRVAVVVHHGGAGHTTAAACAGAPQVIIPQNYDQHYWAHRVEKLGIGIAHAPGSPTVDSLTKALQQSLHKKVSARARVIAEQIQRDGTRNASEGLLRSSR